MDILLHHTEGREFALDKIVLGKRLDYNRLVLLVVVLVVGMMGMMVVVGMMGMMVVVDMMDMMVMGMMGMMVVAGTTGICLIHIDIRLN